MTDTKLITLLKKLTPDEMRDLEKYIASPYFSKSRDLNPLFSILKKLYPDFSGKDLNNEYLFHSLYPGKKYEKVKSDNLIKTLYSGMFRMCKNFLSQNEFMKDTKRREFYLLNQLRKKQLNKEFEKEFTKITEEDNFSNRGSMEYFMENYYLKSVFRDYSLDNDDFKNTYENALSAGELTSVMALIKCLRYADEKTLADMYNLETRYNLTDNLLRHLNFRSLIDEMKKNNDRFYPYVYTYYLVYLLNTGKSTDVYFDLKNHLNEYAEIFGKDELYILRSILLTFCSIMSAGKERKRFQREQFELNDGNLKLGIYKRSREEDFHVVLFRNMVLNSSAVGETEWLEKFIETYSPELPDKHRENMINFSKAFLCISGKEYEKALEYFSKIRLNLFFFKIDVRIFQLIIYYELNYTEQAYSLIDSTNHFLTDTGQASEIVTESTKNFLKYYKEIMKLKNTKLSGKSDASFLLNEIKENKVLASRDWLVEKAQELMQ